MAITKYDQFDFLIDIVPRDDMKPVTTKREESSSSVRMVPDQVSYYFQLAQQHQQALQTSSAPSAQQQQQQQQQQQPQQQPQVVQAGASGGVQTITVNSPQQQQQPPQPQVIQLQPQQMTGSVAPPLGGIQIVQQIVGPSGEIQQIPIQLNQQQLQMIRAQMIGGDSQPIVIQTAPIQAQLSTQQQTIQLQGGQQVYIQQE